MKMIRILFLCLFVLSLVIACDSTSAGSDDNETEATPTPTTTATATPKPEATATATSTPTSTAVATATPTGTAGGSSYQVTLTIPAVSSVGASVVYAAWIEDTNGNNLQNLYVCNTVLGIGKNLLGTALPYWYTEKYSESNPDNYPEIDGITGSSYSSTVNSTTFPSTPAILNIGSETEFVVCLEIDRSVNGNSYFTDRPSFIYKSGTISLSNLSTSAYELTLTAFMANDTESSTYGQTPMLQLISGYGTVDNNDTPADPSDDVSDVSWEYITDTSYIEPINMFVTNGKVTVSVQEL